MNPRRVIGVLILASTFALIQFGGMKAALVIMAILSLVGMLLELVKLVALDFPLEYKIVISKGHQQALVFMMMVFTVIVCVAAWGW